MVKRVSLSLMIPKVFILSRGFVKKPGRISERNLKMTRDRLDDFLSRLFRNVVAQFIGQ